MNAQNQKSKRAQFALIFFNFSQINPASESRLIKRAQLKCLIIRQKPGNVIITETDSFSIKVISPM